RRAGRAGGRRPRLRPREEAPPGGAGGHPVAAAAARRGRDALPPGDEGRPALGQELHGAELPEPRLVYACRARRDRPSARRLLIDVRGSGAAPPTPPTG